MRRAVPGSGILYAFSWDYRLSLADKCYKCRPVIASATATATGAVRLKWQVLDWNEPAIAFYKKLGATIEDEWFNGNLDEAQLARYHAAPAAVAVAEAITGRHL